MIWTEKQDLFYATVLKCRKLQCCMHISNVLLFGSVNSEINLFFFIKESALEKMSADVAREKTKKLCHLINYFLALFSDISL
jgi:hypothetical protein